MYRYPFHQSLTKRSRTIRRNNKGMTLVELVMGLVIIGVVAGIITGLFKAGITSFHHTLRQTLVLANARKAFEGDGSSHGLLWQARQAGSVNTLSPSDLHVDSPQGFPVKYTVSDGTLWNIQQGDQTEQAKAITALQTKYYRMSDEGFIAESVTASSATMVTVFLHMESPRKKTYHFFSGGRLRNHLQ